MSLERKSTLLVGAVLLLCALGGATSLGLLHAHVNPEGALLTRWCPSDAAGASRCAAALDTRWARIAIPVPRLDGWTVVIRSSQVPVAFLGAAYFAFLGVWFLLIGSARPWGLAWHGLPRTVAAAGGTTSLVFVGLMAFTSAPWCAWCLVVHGVNALLVPLVWRATRRPRLNKAVAAVCAPEQLARFVLTSREALVTVLVAFLTIGGIWGYWRQARVHRHRLDLLAPRAALINELRRDPAFLMREFAAQPVVLKTPVPLRPSERAADDQPVMLVFSDFECPACRCHASGLRDRMESRFGERIRILLRHYPLCASCNDGAGDIHPNACDAAYAAEAARLQGGEEAFLRMHDALFEDANALGPGVYGDLARTIGLDAERLVHDMGTPAVRDVVAADIALGNAIGVKGTPTTLLDGRRIPEVCDTPSFFTAYVDRDAIDRGSEAIVHARPESVLAPVITEPK